MAYPTIRATRLRGSDTSKTRRPCARCGNVREARASTILCADCTDTMTPQERALWRRRAA